MLQKCHILQSIMYIIISSCWKISLAMRIYKLWMVKIMSVGISWLVCYIHTCPFGSMLTRLQRIFFLLLRKTCDITLLLMWTIETCYRSFFDFLLVISFTKNKKLLQITYFFQWSCFDHIIFPCFDIVTKSFSYSFFNCALTLVEV